MRLWSHPGLSGTTTACLPGSARAQRRPRVLRSSRDSCRDAGARTPAHRGRLQPRRLDRVRDDARRRLHGALRRRRQGQRRPRPLRTVCKMLRRSFPDVAITIEDLVVEGDKIVNRYIERGTLTGLTFLGIEAGRPALREAGHDDLPRRRRSTGRVVGRRGHARLVPPARQVHGLRPSETERRHERPTAPTPRQPAQCC